MLKTPLTERLEGSALTDRYASSNFAIVGMSGLSLPSSLMMGPHSFSTSGESAVKY